MVRFRMMDVHTWEASGSRIVWRKRHCQGVWDLLVDLDQGDARKYGVFDECNSFQFILHLVALPLLIHFLSCLVQLLVLCPLDPLCLHPC